jgi:hypothetical protein
MLVRSPVYSPWPEEKEESESDHVGNDEVRNDGGCKGYAHNMEQDLVGNRLDTVGWRRWRPKGRAAGDAPVDLLS